MIITLTPEQTKMLAVIVRWARGAAGELARDGEHGPTHAVLAALVQAYAETFGLDTLAWAVGEVAKDETVPLMGWATLDSLHWDLRRASWGERTPTVD